MIRLLYNLLFPLALLFFLPAYAVKMFRRGNYRNKFGQRLGFYDQETRDSLSQGHHTWLHAVSVGEVMIALKLAAKMKEREPALRVALTTTTTTGFTLARKQAPPWIEILYTPLDFWPVMHRAFAVIRPTRIVLVEAEVWPNLTAIAHQRKIPLALVNARLSPRSEGRFRKFNLFVRPYFQKLDLICVQEPEDVARWVSLGVESFRIHPVGSIKFDPANVEPRPELPRAVLRTLGIESGSADLARRQHASGRRGNPGEGFFSNCAATFPRSFSSSRRAMSSARGRSRLNCAPPGCRQPDEARPTPPPPPTVCSSIRPANYAIGIPSRRSSSLAKA